MSVHRLWKTCRLWGITFLLWMGIAALLERGWPITSAERLRSLRSVQAWSTVLLATVGSIVGVLLVSPAARGEEEEGGNE